MKSIILLLLISLVFAIALPTEEDTINLQLLQKDETLPDALKNYKFSSDNNILNDSRIVGGEEAIPHAFPYTVGLNIFTNSGTMVWCGASLIADNYVLTAGHCLQKARDIIIYLGCHGMTDKDCIKIKTDKDNVIIHEKFKAKNFENDIALIKLPSLISVNENIQIIKLPKYNSIGERSLEGKRVTVTGWGYYQDNHPQLSNFLRFINVNIMNLEICKIKFQGIPRKTNICIDGTNGKSTCNGDSGGPLVYINENGEKILVGLSSFGAKIGCTKGWPAVFTRISSYLDWILLKISL